MYKISILIAAVLFVTAALTVAVMGRHGTNETHGDHSAHVAMITSERTFIEHMIPHHEEAVVSAQLMLEKGIPFRPLSELVQKIISGQTTEIDQMKSWYEAWYEVPYQDVGRYEPMMRPLEELSGDDLNRTFLEDMILHHEAAVLAAEAVLKLSISTETKRLASNIIATQEVEIALMRELQGLLPR